MDWNVARADGVDVPTVDAYGIHEGFRAGISFASVQRTLALLVRIPDASGWIAQPHRSIPHGTAIGISIRASHIHPELHRCVLVAVMECRS